MIAVTKAPKAIDHHGKVEPAEADRKEPRLVEDDHAEQHADDRGRHLGVVGQAWKSKPLLGRNSQAVTNRLITAFLGGMAWKTTTVMGNQASNAIAAIQFISSESPRAAGPRPRVANDGARWTPEDGPGPGLIRRDQAWVMGAHSASSI